MSNTNPILILEDSDADYLAIKRACKQRKIVNPLIRCKNGLEALQVAKRSTGHHQETLAMILADLNMPGMDGRRFISAVRSLGTLKHLPIIVFSSSKNASDIQEVILRGANSFVQKPLDFTSYAKTVYMICEYWCNINLIVRDN